MARSSSGDKTKAQRGATRKPPPAAAKPAKKAQAGAKPAAAKPAAAKPAAPKPAATEPRLSVAAALLRKSARRIGA
ncbi:hypothetical protein [Elioraea sp.]|uniref:hypothetical protein n=1 Tax=Elioraea sp. TaxID=2185103 RepID=UPI003F6F1FF8